MIGRGLLVLTMLANCVLSLPVTSSQLENEDVQVMKCIVEALADVLSRPRPLPVSQECLVLLKTDDRLVTILRRHNFLKELQEIAVQGGQERAQLQRDAAAPLDPVTETPPTPGDASDRSMLEALGGPGERSILSQKRRTGNRDGEGEKSERRRDGESQEDGDIVKEVHLKREDEESPGSHVSESVEEWSEGKAEKREGEEEEEEEEEEGSKAKRVNSEENSEEENMTKVEKSAASDEKRDAHGGKSKGLMFGEKDEEEQKKRSSLFSHKQEEDVKRGSRESLKRWAKRGKNGLQLKKKTGGKEAQHVSGQQEVPHHSKELAEDGEEKKKKRDTQRSPEEKELQMLASRAPEERKGLEEEGSASRKTEEPEIESLAAIESELENVAQKLHELRRG
ncbi:putative chromogranin-A [Scophthalmus maximus]|uniref:Chromogranin-A n=1 Tax=Scophthalmus maximus TaxID=52904 RepID=A0A2U9CT35_SCOMX|nr:putative chromogranin-A [Scophthalmus maximus]